MEPEEIETSVPGNPSQTRWSKGRDFDIRNVEAEGSNPFTSTGGPGQGLEVKISQIFIQSDAT